MLLVGGGAWSPRLVPVLHMQAWVTVGALLEYWRLDSALPAHERAVAAYPDSDRPYVILGDAYRRAAPRPRAVDAYAAALTLQPHNVAAAVPLMRLHQQAGRFEAAARVRKEVGTSDTDLIAWAWRAMTGPFADELAIGDGFEFGHLTNVYPPERNEAATFRWTNGHGLIRLTAPPGGAGRLRLRLSGGRPPGAPPADVTLIVNGRPLDAFTAAGGWQTRVIDLRPMKLGGGMTVLIEVQSDTFVPAQLTPGSSDRRRLGVALDHITLDGPESSDKRCPAIHLRQPGGKPDHAMLGAAFAAGDVGRAVSRQPRRRDGLNE